MSGLPVETTDDVLSVWPAEYKQETVAPVRDAVVASQTAMFLRSQEDSQYAADQANVARATRRYLDGHGEDRDIARSNKETDVAYRARVLAVPEIVTPLAILDAVNAILGQYTPIKAQYLESIHDRAYLRFQPHEDTGGGPVGESAALIGATPHYPARLYPEDEAANGAARVQCSPGGMWIFSDHVGRYFVLRVPDLSGLDTTVPSIYFSSAPATAPGRFFVGNGSSPSPSYIYASDVSALGVYGALVSAVDAIVGHSIRWKMISDPKLK